MYTEHKKETSHTFLRKFKLQNNSFRYCYVFLSLVRHQTTIGTNLVLLSISCHRFIPLRLNTPTIKTRNAHAQALNFLSCHNWLITINQKPYEHYDIQHTV